MINRKDIFRFIPLDEWGDEETWKTAIDFTEINPGGILAEELLYALKQYGEPKISY
ncbi:MAG: hypothetical protein NT077_03625 [Candidatus Taylorbacteria bacterium]|nr:hypothetical protein [Candidatus Taylorbacteria bacterium]